MPISYKITHKRNTNNGKNEVKYYAVKSRSSLVSTTEICKSLARKSTLSQADIRACVAGLSEEIVERLLAGSSVQLDGLGIFSLTVTSQGFDSPEEITPRRVIPGKICFRPTPDMKREIREATFVRSAATEGGSEL